VPMAVPPPLVNRQRYVRAEIFKIRTYIELSPLFLVGLRILVSDRISLNLGASYASYADTFRSFGRDFDLSPSGWTLRPALQFRL
jgi:hypothetical protein